MLEAGLELAGVVDEINTGREFMGHTIADIAAEPPSDGRVVVITSLKRIESLKLKLHEYYGNMLIRYPEDTGR